MVRGIAGSARSYWRCSREERGILAASQANANAARNCDALVAVERLAEGLGGIEGAREALARLAKHAQRLEARAATLLVTAVTESFVPPAPRPRVRHSRHRPHSRYPRRRLVASAGATFDAAPSAIRIAHPSHGKALPAA